MKVPLEPIPTEQMAVTSDSATLSSNQMKKTEPTSVEPLAPTASPMNKCYPWLLGVSVCLSGVLCWMYVTKPVMAPAAVTAAETKEDLTKNVIKVTPVVDIAKGVPLVPSENLLPGESPDTAAAVKGARSSNPVSIPPRQLSKIKAGASTEGDGWENTNLKVQHILSADSGSGELEKIILNVPVRYETRSMRWTPEDIKKARNVLARLMVYERDLNNLRQQGKGILKDWNSLLENTVPSEVLRADSPSLPYNQGYGVQPSVLPDSSSVIKVDKPKAPQK